MSDGGGGATGNGIAKALVKTVVSESVVVQQTKQATNGAMDNISSTMVVTDATRVEAVPQGS